MKKDNLLKAYVLLVLMVQTTFAQQQVTQCDEQNIKRKSLALINNLADKYNLFLGSDSFDRTNLLESMTLSSQFGMSDFENDQVIIEDDFTTKTIIGKDNLDKKVDIYFRDLGIYYGKKDSGEYLNEGKEISFSNITTSKIMYSSKGQYLYLQVFFEVIYGGVDSRTNLPFKQPSNRVAELKIQKMNDVWQIAILSIRNFEKQTMFTATANEVLIQPCTKEQKSVRSSNEPLSVANPDSKKVKLRDIDDSYPVALVDKNSEYSEQNIKEYKLRVGISLQHSPFRVSQSTTGAALDIYTFKNNYPRFYMSFFVEGGTTSDSGWDYELYRKDSFIGFKVGPGFKGGILYIALAKQTVNSKIESSYSPSGYINNTFQALDIGLGFKTFIGAKKHFSLGVEGSRGRVVAASLGIVF